MRDTLQSAQAQGCKGQCPSGSIIAMDDHPPQTDLSMWDRSRGPRTIPQSKAW